MSRIEYITVRELTSDQIKKIADIQCVYNGSCSGCCMVIGAYCVRGICQILNRRDILPHDIMTLKICKARLLKHGIKF